MTARELARQAARAVERLNPSLAAVIEVFDDVVRKPDADGPSKDGALYGVPIFLKDLGSGLKGRRQDSGIRLFEGARRPGHRSGGRELPRRRASCRSAGRPRPSSA